METKFEFSWLHNDAIKVIASNDCPKGPGPTWVATISRITSPNPTIILVVPFGINGTVKMIKEFKKWIKENK